MRHLMPLDYQPVVASWVARPLNEFCCCAVNVRSELDSEDDAKVAS